MINSWCVYVAYVIIRDKVLLNKYGGVKLLYVV